MSSIWKSKVMPKFKKLFDKGKKKGASEFCKTFDKSKEPLDKEIEEKGADLNPKIVEIYRSSSTFIAKKLLKEPNEGNIKGNPEAAQGILQELAKAGFPGAKGICDAGTKFGPALLPGPILYVFQKVSVYLVEEPLPEEPKEEAREVSVEEVKAATPATKPETTAAVPDAEAAGTPASTEVEKKEEVAKEVDDPAATTPPPPAVAEAASATEMSATDVVETLAESGVAIPAAAADDTPPDPAHAPPPAGNKTV
ncbi:hypothetical protein L7F22_022040 [Adiantum nelumboides]|nr:hypothetical protein [Adiantum nelumboides]